MSASNAKAAASGPKSALPASSGSALSRWIMAARPATLTAAAVPVAVGTAVAFAHGGAQLWPALAALWGAAWIQIGTNFANDVFDHDKGADGADRLGPTRAVAAGLISPRAMRLAMVFAFGMALLCGLYLTAVAGWPVVAIGVLSIASGVAYTGGPYPLGYNGLGDLFVFVFFGFVGTVGTTYVQTLNTPADAFWAAVPVGALATAILVVNNVRDREGDARARKRTLVVRLGRRAAVAEYAGLILAAYAVPLVMALRGGAYILLLPLVTAPLALALVLQVARREGRSLNATLKATAMLLLAHGLTWSLGLVLSTGS